MEFPTVDAQREKVLAALRNEIAFRKGEAKVILSPLRVCPVGAHIDHQGGPVLGAAINAGTLVAFLPAARPRVDLRSLNFRGRVQFSFHEAPPADMPGWGMYACGAAGTLAKIKPLHRGIIGVTTGSLIGSGLSSSASIGLAYLRALAHANEIELAAEEYVELDRQIENDYLGLQNGILDPATIVHARRHHLLFIDTIRGSVRRIAGRKHSISYRLLIAFSGITRALVASGYNSRVDECREAARRLGAFAGIPSAGVLSDVPVSVFATHGKKLPAPLQKRARHFYSEVGRVHHAVQAWERGDIVRLGAIMNESCHSSMTQYECGSPELQALHEIVSAAPGVAGSRFSGGGFGGCVAGYVLRASADAAAEAISRQYATRFPALKNVAEIYFAELEDGIRML